MSTLMWIQLKTHLFLPYLAFNPQKLRLDSSFQIGLKGFLVSSDSDSSKGKHCFCFFSYIFFLVHFCTYWIKEYQPYGSFDLIVY